MPLPRPVMVRLLKGVGAAVALGGCVGSALVVGLLKGAADANRIRCDTERRAVEPVLADDPAFAGVVVRCWPKGNAGVYLAGRVPTRDDHRRLVERVRAVLGTAHEEFDLVQVGPAP